MVARLSGGSGCPAEGPHGGDSIAFRAPMIVPAPNVTTADCPPRAGGRGPTPAGTGTFQALEWPRTSAASRWRSRTAISRGVAP